MYLLPFTYLLFEIHFPTNYLSFPYPIKILFLFYFLFYFFNFHSFIHNGYIFQIPNNYIF